MLFSTPFVFEQVKFISKSSKVRSIISLSNAKERKLLHIQLSLYMPKLLLFFTFSLFFHSFLLLFLASTLRKNQHFSSIKLMKIIKICNKNSFSDKFLTTKSQPVIYCRKQFSTGFWNESFP